MDKFVRILLLSAVVASLFAEAFSENETKPVSVQACGANLMDIVTTICSEGAFAFRKKRFIDISLKDKFIGKEAAGGEYEKEQPSYSHLRFGRQAKVALTSTCCHRACTLEQLAKFCGK